MRCIGNNVRFSHIPMHLSECFDVVKAVVGEKGQLLVLSASDCFDEAYLL